MHVLHLINSIEPTSNSLEIAQRVASATPADVSLVAFYDSPDDIAESHVPPSVNTACLDASTRFDIGAYIALRRFAKQRSIDILHTHDNSVGSFARLAFTGSSLGVVNTEHRSHESFSPLQLVTNAASYPQIDVMAYNSDHTSRSIKRFERLLLRETICETVYNGVDIERIATSDDSCSEDYQSGPVITNVARMIEIKNQKLLIDAFIDVLKTYPDATLLMVGDGPLRSELESMVTSAGIDASVKFVGEVSRDKVYTLLKKSTIFVMPSLSEGFCVAAVEAMAAGLPVVASDIEVLREVVNGTGLFADPEDADSFANIVKSLLDDPGRQQKLGEQAKQRVHSNFSLEQVAWNYYDLYRLIA